VKRIGKTALILGLAAWLASSPSAASAQSPSATPATTQASRVDELVKLAREKFEEGQAQPAQAGQQKTLEERAVARPVVKLTIDQAVKMAIENNIELAVERLNPQLQDLSIAQTRGAFKPTLGSTLNANSSSPLPTSLLNGGTQVTNEVANANVNISQTLPWFGTSYTGAFNNSRTNTTSTFATLNPQFVTQLTATVTQPLLRNFKIDANRQSLLTGAITREITDINLKTRLTNTTANVKNAYWDLLYTIRAIDAAQQSLSLAEKLIEDNRVRVEVGTLAPMDIISAQAEAATRRQTLTQAVAARYTAELVFKRLIVSDTNDPVWRSTIDPTDMVQVLPTTVNLEAAVTTALGQRTDLVSARKSLASNDITLRYLKNQMMPGLDATATVGTRGLGGNQFIRDNGVVVGTIPGGWPDAFAMMRRFDYPNWTLGVTFSYPLGQSAQEAAYARAKLQYQQSQAQIHGLELTVATEVTNAALLVESTLKSLDAARAARQLSEKRLENEQSKFEVGMSTNFFVVQAQRDLLDAQNAELRAALNYQKALVGFDRVQLTSGGGTASTSSSSTSTSGSSSGG
jgi:outer membrane protein